MMPCPECGRMNLRAGYEKAERVLRHGDVTFNPCYIHCRRPRIKCKEHGVVVEAPWQEIQVDTTRHANTTCW